MNCLRKRLFLSPDSTLVNDTLSFKSTHVTLIWFDEDIDKDLNDLLQNINDHVLTVSDRATFLDYVQAMDNETIVILSGTNSQTIIPIIHDNKQIDSIYIFCINDSKYKYLCDLYPKIMGIYIEYDLLFKSLQKKAHIILKQQISLNLFDQLGQSMRDLTRESSEFLWYQLLRDYIMKMVKKNDSKQNMLEKFRVYYKTNKSYLAKIDEFEQTYTAHDAIKWYTKGTFLFQLVNKALRTQDIEALLAIRYYVVDLCKCLKEECENVREYYDDVVQVYRGQTLSDAETDRLNNSIDQLISSNGFLSTSRSLQVASLFATNAMFIIDIITQLESIVFVDIRSYSEISEEEEVIFDIGTTFKILKIEYDDSDKLYKIHLVTVDESKKLTNSYIEKQKMDLGWRELIDYHVGNLLIEMGQPSKAVRFYENLLEEAKDDEDRFIALFGLATACLNNDQNELAAEYAYRCYKLYESIPYGTVHGLCRIFDLLATVDNKQNKYERAIYYSTQILKMVPADDTSMISVAHSNLACVYFSQGDMEMALQYLKQTAKIDEILYPTEDLSIADNNFNVGVCYYRLNEFNLALKHYEQSLAVREKVLPYLHIDTALVHIGLAETKFRLTNYNQSLDHWKRALAIVENGRLCNSTQEAVIHENIAACFCNMGKFVDSIWHCDKSLSLYKRCRTIKNLANLYVTYGNVYHGINEFDKAIENFLTVLTLIDENNERQIAQMYDCIAGCYAMKSEYLSVIEYSEKSLAIQEKLDPLNEIAIAGLFHNIGASYCSLHSYNLALEYCTRSKELYDKCVCHHIEEYGLALCTLSVIYYNLNQKDLAYEYSLLSMNHLTSPVSENYEILANTYFDMKNQTSAFNYYCKSLDIIKSTLPLDQQALERVSKLCSRINEVEF